MPSLLPFFTFAGYEMPDIHAIFKVRMRKDKGPLKKNDEVFVYPLHGGWVKVLKHSHVHLMAGDYDPILDSNELDKLLKGR